MRRQTRVILHCKGKYFQQWGGSCSGYISHCSSTCPLQQHGHNTAVCHYEESAAPASESTGRKTRTSGIFDTSIVKYHKLWLLSL